MAWHIGSTGVQEQGRCGVRVIQEPGRSRCFHAFGSRKGSPVKRNPRPAGGSVLTPAGANGRDAYLFFGGYPGAIPLRSDKTRRARYIRDSLIETVLPKDVLLMSPVQKPALLRQVFGLCLGHPAEILSYQKMLGQLQDAGNTTTIAS